MKSTYEIVWSDEAVKGLKEIISYLENNFSEKDVHIFASKFDAQINLIQNYPKTFTYIRSSSDVRRMFVARLTSVNYRIKGSEIHILSVFDVRQNPERYDV